jgi:Host cell surface-exposed lipoprotein
MTATTLDQPEAPDVQPDPPKPKHSRKFRVLRGIGIGFAGLVVLSGVIGAIEGPQPVPAAAVSAPATPTAAIQGIQAIPPGVAAPAKATPKPAAKVAPKPAVTVTAKAAPAPAVTVTAPPAAPAQPAAPAAPAVTGAQAQALQSAQGYLGDGQGFSRAGLIAQLDSPYGGQFSVADATWAADHSGADWDAQAVIAAKGYMSDGQGFSRAGLIAQLDSPYGGQFTEAQATYAAGQAGL